ncbi:MAG: hypothetical protein HJJLKODD_02381 [Phycisphaerae bacterium]|nr:hypothetical protein [Phycisphaerae bacterium]
MASVVLSVLMSAMSILTVRPHLQQKTTSVVSAWNVDDSSDGVFSAYQDDNYIVWSRECEELDCYYQLNGWYDNQYYDFQNIILTQSDNYQIEWNGWSGLDNQNGVLLFVPVNDTLVSIEFRGDIDIRVTVTLEDIINYSFAGIAIDEQLENITRSISSLGISKRERIQSECKCTGVEPSGTCSQSQCDTAEDCTAKQYGKCKNVLSSITATLQVQPIEAVVDPSPIIAP